MTNNAVHDVNNIGIDLIGGETRHPAGSRARWRATASSAATASRARARATAAASRGGIYVDGGRDIVVENNVVTECDLGLEVGAENAGVDATGIVVRSNVLHANDKAGLVFGGYASNVGRVRDSTFRNNTLYGNDTLGAGFGELWIQFADGNTVEDNIFYGDGATALAHLGGAATSTTTSTTTSFSPTPVVPRPRFLWNGTVYAVFAAYRAATEQDAHRSFADPLFANAGGGRFPHRRASYAIDSDDPAFVAGARRGRSRRRAAHQRPARRRRRRRVHHCGDGIHEFFEQCDDGNAIDGDGCDSNCTTTGCGNRIVTAGEHATTARRSTATAASAASSSRRGRCDDGNACTTSDTCTAGAASASKRRCRPARA